MIVEKIYIKVADDYDKLFKVIPECYLSPQLVSEIKQKLSKNIRTVLVEYPYVDKDYRSTYYGFYAKRHRSYSKFCYRLHFFDQIVKKYFPVGMDNSYLGSIVLRPTNVASMGRTLLSPTAINDFKGYICEASFENNIIGVPFKINTFPHIMQDTDVTVCAHAVCWMIARYYSEKYSVYPERLLYDIADAVKDVSRGRNIPSRGLTLGQISEVLTSIGFYPEIFVRELYPDHDFFYDILYAYVESGIPLVAGMVKKEHAVAIIGHGPVSLAKTKFKTVQGMRFNNSRRLIDSLIINNDNELPFSSLRNSISDNEKYCLEDVDAFVVPLYEKMYLNAENVLNFYHGFVYSDLLDIPERNYVSRIYMTSSRSYKRELIRDKSINIDMLKAQIELPMPKFIWIIELSCYKNYDSRKADYRWIIDGTANQYEKYPFLFLHDSKKMILYDRALAGKLYSYTFPESLGPYKIYMSNLKGENL